MGKKESANKKTGGDGIKVQRANWKFSGSTVNKFDKHIWYGRSHHRSIPVG